MKKFLMYLLILVFVISFSGVIFYLAREDEVLDAKSESYFLNVGEIVEPEYDVENVKKSTKIKIVSSDDKVIKVEDGKLSAVGKGTSVVSISLTNARKKSTVVQQTISVGDGSSAQFPIYIRNEIDLQGIGTKYSLDKFFTQTCDITLSSGSEFKTIDGTFTGNYNGHGYKIKNYKQTGDKITSAMFNKIGETGTVGFVIFENVEIDGHFSVASVVANQNFGLIDYVEVSGKIVNKDSTGSCAGIVGKNFRTLNGVGQVQRCVNKAQIKTDGFLIGGIVAENAGIVTSCQNGDTSITDAQNSDFIFTNASLTGAVSGGIVGKNHFNTTLGDETDTSTQVSNSFSINKVVVAEGVDLAGNYFGGVIGADLDGEDSDYVSLVESKFSKNIFGNYYIIYDGDAVKRGIGNVSTTIPENASSTNMYITNGITLETLQQTDSAFVSYVISFESGATSLQSWPQDVWELFETDLSGFPRLKAMSEFGFTANRLGISLPLAVIGSEFEISNITNFITKIKDGTLTNPSNKGKTYYIASDLDLTGQDFDMIGTEERPLCVNLIGLTNESMPNGPTISGITIQNNASKSIGFIAAADGAIIENITLKNCMFVADDTAEYIGGLVGYAKNTKITNCRVVADKNQDGVYQGAISAGSETKAVGGLVGFAEGGSITRAFAEIEIGGTTLNDGITQYVGGIVGKLGGDSETFGQTDFNSANVAHYGFATTYVNDAVFNGKINCTASSQIYAGGCAGLVNLGADVFNFRANGEVISAQYAGGIAGKTLGVVENSSVKSTLNAPYAGGFAYELAGANSRVYHSYCETDFTNGNATLNAGIAGVVDPNNSFISQCVNVNNFLNDSKATKNYSKVGSDVKFDFDANGKISELNPYNSQKLNEKVVLHNCFYVNRVDGKDSNDYNKVRFYSQSGEYPPQSFGNYWTNFVDAKYVLNGKFNGTVRNGRMLYTGGLAKGPNTSVTWIDFGFDPDMWINADKCIVTGGNLLHKSVN